LGNNAAGIENRYSPGKKLEGLKLREQSVLEKPDISIYASAHRPHNWMDLYRSIGHNDVSFEIVFVGPNVPDFELPDNFKFIKSRTKPTQCVEIAVRNTSADLIMNIADDTEFRTEKPLDILYQAYKSFNNNKILLSCRYMYHGQDISDDSSQIMPLSALMSKKLYYDIGGIDRNFIAIMWDCDIAMRVYAMGGEVILSNVYLDEIESKRHGSILCREFWSHDRKLLERLWSINKKTHLNRTKPVEPFSDLRILEESQGPRGRWHGTSPVLVEKIVDFPKNNIKILMRIIHRIIFLFGRVCHALRNPAKYPMYAKRVCHALRNPAKYPVYAKRILGT
jgi:hypothetical protein